MPDTHDERGGNEASASGEARAFLASSKRTRFGRVFVEHLLAEHDDLREQLAAVTARAEKAEAERDRERSARQLDGRHVDRTLALLLMRQGGAVEFSLSEMESAPQHGEFMCIRNLTTGGTRLAFQAADACRSCGETERVLGDPPLCSNCAVYGPTYRGAACWPPIAAPDGLSQPVERSEPPGGHGEGSNSSATAAGPSEPEPPRDTSAWCWAPHCGLLRDHEPPHRRGERTWIDDDTTEGRP